MYLTYLFGTCAMLLFVGALIGYYRTRSDGLAGFGLLFAVVSLIACGLSASNHL